MQNQDLRPIPIPLKQRWHDFRVAYVPLLTFLVLVATICWMWMRYVQPGAIIGEVETVRASIISVVSGTLRELKVDRLQAVTNGQELAVLAALDPDQLNAELVAAEAELRLMKARMDLDKGRNLDSLARLRADWLTEQLNLNIARVRLQQAEAEYERVQKLFDTQIVARGVSSRDDTGLDVALRDRDALRSEVASRTTNAADLQASVEHLQATGVVQVNPTDTAVEQAILAQRARIERLQKPVLLRSPVTGFVSAIHHYPGERVAAGDPILVVSGGRTDRIIAWVRLPVTLRPQAGDIVEVRSVAMGQSAFQARVVDVGTQLESISSTLLPASANANRVEVGLPLMVKAEQVLNLIPGEPVQLRVIRPGHNQKAN